LKSMLGACLYNGHACTTSDFRSFLSSKFGLCYTFNAKVQGLNGSQVRSIIDHGGVGKLELHLYAHSHLYVPSYAGGQFSLTAFTTEAIDLFIQGRQPEW
jgi:hypothetical protein